MPFPEWPPPRRRVLEHGLLFVGLLATGWPALVAGEQYWRDAASRRSLAAAFAVEAPVEAGDLQTPPPGDGEVLGRVVVGTRSALVQEGVEPDTLRVAAGRVPGTAWPPAGGNVAIAGHRDTVFRMLSGVSVDDRVQLVLPGQAYDYVVDDVRVVDPKDTWVLDPSDEPRLTLITCYPFSYIGPAPKRLVVRARAVDAGSLPGRH